MKNKGKLKRILDSLSANPYESFDKSISGLKDKLQTQIKAETLDDVNSKLKETINALDLDPLVQSVEILKEEVAKREEEISNEIETTTEQLKSLVKKSSSEMSNTVETKTTLLSDEISTLRGRMKTLEVPKKDELPAIRTEIIKLEERVRSFVSNNIEELERETTFSLKKKLEKAEKDFKDEVEKAKTELLVRINNIGGGAPNQKISVNGTWATSRYADINIVNPGATVTNNNTTKTTTITLAGGTEADTLQTVTDRGATTTVLSTFSGGILPTSIGSGRSLDSNSRFAALLSSTYNKGFYVQADQATGRYPFGFFVTGDAQLRYTVNAGGEMVWGDGTSVADTNLYRSAANVLKTDDGLIVNAGVLDTSNVLSVNSNSRRLIRSDGTTVPLDWQLDRPQLESWGQIRGTTANAGAGTYDYTGTVTSDGTYIVDDAGKMEVVKAGKYLIIAQAWTDAEPPSGFGGYYLRILKNGTAISDDGTFMCNAEQLFSGAGGPERMVYQQSGVTHVIATLAVNDIINAESQTYDVGNAPGQGNQIFTITMHYVGN